jgi:ATP phosphoribosyltransferase regulatory subunit
MERRDRPDYLVTLLDILSALDTELVEVPIVQPSAPFLDAVGENLRHQIFMTENESGASLCVRPDFTIPVCLHHLQSKVPFHRRYAYLGKVFRQDSLGPREMLQSGIEDIGDRDVAAADARVMANACYIAQTLLIPEGIEIVMGDQAVFQAVVQALDLHGGWQRRFIQAFGDHRQIELLLSKLAKPDMGPEVGSDVSAILATGDEQRLITYIADMMREHGHRTNGSRTPFEIASRLKAKLAMAETNLSSSHLEILRSFLKLDLPLADASYELADFATKAGLDLGLALIQFKSRKVALEKAGVDTERVRYRAAFGRPFDYYTGLVFEIVGRQTSNVIAGGGRFDRLLTLLGSNVDVPAVGFSLQLDRIDVKSTIKSRCQ